eukprot:CAMPEP_0198139700 /NCGR_PEP_ID=MMETSP1443-20131203/2960_1 /TAXON_ID=186043 /ORGANISM="Entomoneis sp., Strain CCMP2396" /LENGTH=248 /DNA_ID=CAMNT_0043801901 /DNA_START=148 /DNA_END=894 /DNA_ORIENTATION=+
MSSTAAAAAGATTTKKAAALIFLHGLGDGPSGWSMLQHQLPALKPRLAQVQYVFPQSPEIPLSINGGMVMPGWFDLYEWPIQVGDPDDKKGKLAAVAQMEREIEKLVTQGIPRNKIAIGGFSQGGAIALLTTYYNSNTAPQQEHQTPPLAACISLSGWLTLTNEFKSVNAQNKDTPLFWGHGEYDDKVLFGQQKHGIETLSNAGVDNLQFQSYPMGHESCSEEMQGFAEFLDESLFGGEDQKQQQPDL